MITHYDHRRKLIIVDGLVWGPSESISVRLAIDTGCPECTLLPRVARQLGYDPERDGVETTMRSAVGVEHGHLITIAKLEALDYSYPQLPVHVFELANGWGIDGLIGLRFLDELNYEIRAREGIIISERADTGPVSGGS